MSPTLRQLILTLRAHPVSLKLMQYTKRLVACLLLGSLLSCVETYPGGLSKQEWDSLPPERRAEIKLTQDQLDEERRENNQRDNFNREVLEKPSDVEVQVIRTKDDSDDAMPGWSYIGHVEAAFHRDHDAIEFTHGPAKFHELKFVVRRGDLDLYNMIVFVSDTDATSPKVRGHYDKNTASHAIRLPANRQTVRRVDFDYVSTDRRDGKAMVYLYGR